jgi:drug/metabolite transporter (DMT)-like permease
MSRQDVASHAAAFWAAVLFGVSVVATRIVAQQMPPISLAVLRFGLGSLILLLCLVVVAPGYLYVARRDLALFLLLGAVPFGAFPVLFDAGLRLTTASRGALMLATMPLWTAVLAWLAREERPDARQMMGIALTIVGVGIVLAEHGLTWQETARTMLGDGMMLAAALCGAVYSALAPRALARYTATTVTAYTMAAGVLLLLPGACTERGWKAAAGLDATGIVLVLFLGLLGGALGYLCLTYSLTHLAPTQATIYVNVNPVVAAALAGLLLDEQLTIAFGAGLIAVIGGVLLVNVSARRPRERRVAPPAVAPPARV